ncbi:MAG: helix-turn-helix domain-containing protein [Rubrivivax sp.]
MPRLTDIAAIVDTAPETVSRILSHWRRQPLLQGAGATTARCAAAPGQAMIDDIYWNEFEAARRAGLDTLQRLARCVLAAAAVC